MRLLYVHQSLGSLGGAEANVFITATEFKGRGHAVGLIARARTGKSEENWFKLFDENIFFPKSTSDWNHIIKDYQPDIIFIHKWEDLDSLEWLIKTSYPLIRMVHDHDLYCLRSYKYNPLTRNICTRPATGYCVFPCLASLKRTREGPFPFQLASYFAKKKEIELNRLFDRHLVVTEYMRHELIINGFQNDQIETFPPVPRPVDPIQSNFGPRNLLLYVGQIIRGKGVDVLLKALTLVKEPFEVIILGDGHHRNYCEKLSRKLKLENRVQFRGFIPQEELRNYYQDASAILISSVWPEPIATIGLEVMRYALPVVAFDAGGIGDWLKDGENGFLVPWMNTRVYAQQIDRLLRDKELARRMGKEGLKRVSRDYDFKDYILKLENLFMRVKQEPRRRLR